MANSEWNTQGRVEMTSPPTARLLVPAACRRRGVARRGLPGSLRAISTKSARPSSHDLTGSIKVELREPGAVPALNVQFRFACHLQFVCVRFVHLHFVYRRLLVFSVLLQISCDGAEYMAFVFMGTVGVLAVPVGVPGISLLLLVMNTRELRKTDAQGNQNSAAFRRYEFLVADYK